MPSARKKTPTSRKTAAKKASARKTTAAGRAALPLEIGHVIVWVKDMARARKFYEGALGLPVRFFSDGWAEFETKGTVLAIHPTDSGDSGCCSGSCSAEPELHETGISFSVAKVDATLKALRTRGVTIVRKPVEVCPGQRYASFADPDGNILSVHGG